MSSTAQSWPVRKSSTWRVEELPPLVGEGRAGRRRRSRTSSRSSTIWRSGESVMPLQATAAVVAAAAHRRHRLEHGGGVVELDLPAGVGAGQLRADDPLDRRGRCPRGGRRRGTRPAAGPCRRRRGRGRPGAVGRSCTEDRRCRCRRSCRRGVRIDRVAGSVRMQAPAADLDVGPVVHRDGDRLVACAEDVVEDAAGQPQLDRLPPPPQRPARPTGSRSTSARRPSLGPSSVEPAARATREVGDERRRPRRCRRCGRRPWASAPAAGTRCARRRSPSRRRDAPDVGAGELVAHHLREDGARELEPDEHDEPPTARH